MLRQTRPRPFAAALAVSAAALALTLSACSGASPADGGTGARASDSGPSKSSPAAASTPAADGAAAFCSGWKSNGGTLATIGEPVTFYPKDDSIEEIHISYDIMSKLTPPAAIADDWNTYKAFDAKALAALNTLQTGQTLSDPAIGKEGLTMKPHYTAINAWITAHCG